MASGRSSRTPVEACRPRLQLDYNRAWVIIPTGDHASLDGKMLPLAALVAKFFCTTLMFPKR